MTFVTVPRWLLGINAASAAAAGLGLGLQGQWLAVAAAACMVVSLLTSACGRPVLILDDSLLGEWKRDNPPDSGLHEGAWPESGIYRPTDPGRYH